MLVRLHAELYRNAVTIVCETRPTLYVPDNNYNLKYWLYKHIDSGPIMYIMRLLLSTLILAACIGMQADALQIPLQYSSHISWDFFEKPSRNSTSHLIFDTVNSFLQHWTNTRYRNGKMIIVGLIPLTNL